MSAIVAPCGLGCHGKAEALDDHREDLALRAALGRRGGNDDSIPLIKAPCLREPACPVPCGGRLVHKSSVQIEDRKWHDRSLLTTRDSSQALTEDALVHAALRRTLEGMVHRLPPPPMVPHAEYLASLPRKRVITSALIVAEDRRVLCIEPTYKSTWHLPGGTVEQGESPSNACIRECREELGVSIDLGRLLAVGHIEPGAEDPHGALAFIYDAPMSPSTFDSLDLADDEIRSVAWLEDAELHRLLSPLAFRFVQSGLESLDRGGLVEFDRDEGTTGSGRG